MIRLGSPAFLSVLMVPCAVGWVLAQQPLFRAGVDYVKLDVVVIDRDDKPVTNLRKDDFRITESRRFQQIDSFEQVSIPLERRALPDAPIAVPSRDVLTNVRVEAARHWVLLIDDLHLFEQMLVETRRVVQLFFENVSPDDQVAVVFVGRSDLSLDFTNDVGSLAQTMNRLREAIGFALDPPPFREGSQIQCAVRLQFARRTVDVVRNVIASLAFSSFQRRVIVYVSHGFDYRNAVLDQGDRPRLPGPSPVTYAPCPQEGARSGLVFDELLAAFEVARRSGVSVSTVDPRGVTSPMTDGGRRSPNGEALRNQLDHLRLVAAQTGGRAFVNRADMAAAIQELVADSSSFYVLGYYPEPFVRDGKFHEVSVSVVGHPEYRVRARAGYVAPLVSRSAPSMSQLLDEAAAASLPIGGLTLSAFAAPLLASKAGTVKTLVTLELTYPSGSDRPLTEDTLDVRFVGLDYEGKVRSSTQRRFQFRGTAVAGSAVRLLLNDAVELPAERLILRLAVGSRTSGRIGTVHLPLVVPRFDQEKLQMGGPVLGLEGSREPAMNREAIMALVPFQPTVARTFAASDSLRVFARLVWKDAAPAVMVTLTVRGGPKSVVQTEKPVGQVDSGGGRQAILDTILPLAGLSAGKYVLETRAELQSGETVRRDIAFEIR